MVGFHTVVFFVVVFFLIHRLYVVDKGGAPYSCWFSLLFSILRFIVASEGVASSAGRGSWSIPCGFGVVMVYILDGYTWVFFFIVILPLQCMYVNALAIFVSLWWIVFLTDTIFETGLIRGLK